MSGGAHKAGQGSGAVEAQGGKGPVDPGPAVYGDSKILLLSGWAAPFRVTHKILVDTGVGRNGEKSNASTLQHRCMETIL